MSSENFLIGQHKESGSGHAQEYESVVVAAQYEQEHKPTQTEALSIAIPHEQFFSLSFTTHKYT